MLRPLTLACVALATMGAAPRTANLYRDAFTPFTALGANHVTRLSGESDGEPVSADIKLSATKGRIMDISVMQDGKALRLPEAAYAEMTGAKAAWLEERGALTTLVIEGSNANKEWRLALLFHPEQLWQRRLSSEGVRRDNFTFYKGRDMTASKPQNRSAANRGFHWF